MASTSLKQYFVSMEEGEEFDEDGNPVVMNIDSDAVEITQTFAEADEATEDAEELAEVEEGMTEVQEDVEAAVEHGGLDPVAARFAQHAIKAYMSRLGVEADDVMPSLESFGSSSSRLHATQISLEGIGDWIKKIWVAIKTAVARAVKAVSDFFSKLFGGVKRLKTAADSLRKDLKEKNKIKKEGIKINVPSPNSLMFGRSVELSAIVKGIEATSSVLDSQLALVETLKTNLKTTGANTKQFVDEFTRAFTASTQKSAEGQDKAKKTVKAAIDGLTDVAGSTINTVKASIKSGAKISGDRDISYKITGIRDNYKSDILGENTAAIKVKLFIQQPAAGFDDKKEISLNGDDHKNIITILEKIINMCDAIDKKKNALSELSKIRKDALDSIKVEGKFSEAVEKFSEKTKIRFILKAVENDFSSGVTKVCNVSFSIARAAYALCKKAAANFDKP